jgi:DNA-binding response OmpR family regulator
MRILLVDDDLFAAELASIFLQMDGYDVVIVESAISPWHAWTRIATSTW